MNTGNPAIPRVAAKVNTGYLTAMNPKSFVSSSGVTEGPMDQTLTQRAEQPSIGVLLNRLILAAIAKGFQTSENTSIEDRITDADIERIEQQILAEIARLQQAHEEHRKIYQRAEQLILDLTDQRDEAMRVLAPNMPESGLVDACKQVKQVAISEADNSERLQQALTEKEQMFDAISKVALWNKGEAERQHARAEAAEQALTVAQEERDALLKQSAQWEGLALERWQTIARLVENAEAAEEEIARLYRAVATLRESVEIAHEQLRALDDLQATQAEEIARLRAQGGER